MRVVALRLIEHLKVVISVMKEKHVFSETVALKIYKIVLLRLTNT
jgi:hypothetical protein